MGYAHAQDGWVQGVSVTAQLHGLQLASKPRGGPRPYGPSGVDPGHRTINHKSTMAGDTSHTNRLGHVGMHANMNPPCLCFYHSPVMCDVSERESEDCLH